MSLLAVAFAAGLPAAGYKSGPVTTMAQALAAGASTITAPGNLLALFLAGLWFGLVRGTAPGGKAQAAAVGFACAAAGCVASLAIGTLPYLDVWLVGAGLAVAGLMVLDLRHPALALVPLAIIAAMFGFGFGPTFRFGGVAFGGLAAYSAATAAGAAAIVALAAVVGRRLFARGGTRLVRGLGAWAGALCVPLALNGWLQSSASLGASTADFRVDSTRLTEEEIPVLVRSLLEQVHLAFEKEEEKEIYSALAAVAEGEVLADLYLENRAALVLQDDDGLHSDLRAVELEQTAAGPVPGAEGFSVRGVWRVVGSVGHWGHVHDREVRYKADLTVRPVDGSWKLTGFELLDVVRTDRPAP